MHEHTDIVRFIAGHFPSVLNAPDYVSHEISQPGAPLSRCSTSKVSLQNKRTSMHYAAAARDGGHYLKILSKAGADPMAVDNVGDHASEKPDVL